MRVLLVIVSTGVAGYFAWRAWSRPEEETGGFPSEKSEDISSEGRRSRGGQVYDRFVALLWALFDMASGRYLYRVARGESLDNEDCTNIVKHPLLPARPTPASSGLSSTLSMEHKVE